MSSLASVQRSATRAASPKQAPSPVRAVARRRGTETGSAGSDAGAPAPENAGSGILQWLQAASGRIQRTCAACDDEQKIQTKPENGERPAQVAPDNFLAPFGGGQRLDESARTFFENRFARDFQGVRVHDGPHADAAARSIDARAFTVGRDVVFRAGAYAPASVDGRRLLAHELTHVVQQTTTAPVVRREGDPSQAPAVLPCSVATGGAPTPTDFVLFPNDDATLTPLQRAQITNFVVN
jgi:hypothetical protein